MYVSLKSIIIFHFLTVLREGGGVNLTPPSFLKKKKIEDEDIAVKKEIVDCDFVTKHEIVDDMETINLPV